MIVDGLRKGIGSNIIVDYKTNSGMAVYSKGVLKEVIEDPTPMIVVEGKDAVWYISISSIISLKIVESNVED
jgi:hypothetical protein